MKRVLAVLAAVVMIGAALFIRSRLDTSETASDLESSRAVVVCATELTAVCDQVRRDHPELEMRTEDASVTAETLSGSGFSRDTTPIDAWLVPRPFPQMVDESRTFAGLEPLFGDSSPVLARSPLTITVWNDRLETLASSCGADVTWTCIGERSGQPWAAIGGPESWGPVKPGFPDPSASAVGLLVITQGSGQFLGRSDYAANDLEDSAYRSWLGQLKRGVRSYPPTANGAALGQMLSQGKGTFDLAGSVESLSGPLVSTSRYRSDLTVLYPSPVVTADVVLAPLRSSGSGEGAREAFESDTTAAALAANGWRVEGEPLPAGVPTDQPLPDSDGLPRAGVVQALHNVWMTT